MSKVLVFRLNFLAHDIHPDQARFVPNNQALDQTRRIIDYSSKGILVRENRGKIGGPFPMEEGTFSSKYRG